MTNDELREANGLVARANRLSRILDYIPSGQAKNFVLRCDTPEGPFVLDVTPAEMQEYGNRELSRCTSRLNVLGLLAPTPEPHWLHDPVPYLRPARRA